MTIVSIPDQQSDERTVSWWAATRVAFRFCFTYFGLFCLWFAQITFVFTGVLGQLLPDDAIMWQMVTLESVTGWVGRHVFGVDSVIHRDSGSGDQAAVWVGVFCVLVVAVIVTVIWSALDRERTEYSRLSGWFLVFLRLCWSVVDFSVDGTPSPPLTTDENRWQHLVFDQPEVVTYQRMDGELVPAAAEVDSASIDLPEHGATFRFVRPQPDQLLLTGHLGGQATTISLQRVDLNSFTLRNRGFNWVQEYPYFR